MFIVQPEVDLQYRFLLDGPFHPHGLSWRFHCGRRGFTSQRRGPRHGDGDGCGGRWGRFFFFGLGPGGGGGRTTGGHRKHGIISTYGNIVRQTTSTQKIRLLAPSAYTLSDDLAVPAAKRRSTPRLARRGCPDAFALQLPPPPESSRPRRTRCCVELQQCELSLPQQRHWGGGGLAGGCWAAADSCGTALCVTAEGSSVKQWSNRGCFQQKEVEYSPAWADFARKTMLAHTARRPCLATPAELTGARLHLTIPLHTCEKDQRGLCT
jgi:hypothetical protein